MAREKRPFFSQKPALYFDENFPQNVIDGLKRNRRITNYFKIYSVYDFHHENKDDDFQYAFSKKKGFVLVSLDKHFLNDRKFPIKKISGVIVIIAGRNQVSRISQSLVDLTSFLSLIPRPKAFMGDSKFQVSTEGRVMRGRDSITREIKTLTIVPGDTVDKVGRHFHYFG